MFGLGSATTISPEEALLNRPCGETCKVEGWLSKVTQSIPWDNQT